MISYLFEIRCFCGGMFSFSQPFAGELSNFSAGGKRSKRTQRKGRSMKTNKVTSMSVEEIQAATAALSKVRTSMGFLLPLSAAERAAAGRMGPKTVRTTQMRLATARQHKDTLPPSFDLRKFERETALLLALDQCLSASRAIESDVHDTFLAIGKNAVQSAKIAFGHLAVGMAAAEALKNSVRLIKGRRSPRA